MKSCNKCNNSNLKKNSGYPYHDIYECDSCNSFVFERIKECCRNPFEIIIIENREYPLSFIRLQCINCGGCLNMAKPLNKKEYGNLIRGDFNTERFKDWKTEVHEESKFLYELKKDNNYKNSKHYKYWLYLQSKEWKAKRLLVLERDNKKCQHCESIQSIDVHHITYDRLFNELIEDLISLCRPCHNKEHKRLDALLESLTF